MKYSPSRGGHAPGHLRDEFLDLLESGDRTSDRMRELSGLLWNCTDIMPSDYRPFTETWDLPPAFNYAQAARRIRQMA